MIKIQTEVLSPVHGTTNEKKKSRRFTLVPKLNDNGTLMFGLAMCSDRDNFNRKTGTSIALSRIEKGCPIAIRQLPNITRKNTLYSTINGITMELAGQIKNNGNLFRNVINLNSVMSRKKVRFVA